MRREEADRLPRERVVALGREDDVHRVGRRRHRGRSTAEPRGAPQHGELLAGLVRAGRRPEYEKQARDECAGKFVRTATETYRALRRRLLPRPQGAPPAPPRCGGLAARPASPASRTLERGVRRWRRRARAAAARRARRARRASACEQQRKRRRRAAARRRLGRGERRLQVAVERVLAVARDGVAAEGPPRGRRRRRGRRRARRGGGGRNAGRRSGAAPPSSSRGARRWTRTPARARAVAAELHAAADGGVEPPRAAYRRRAAAAAPRRLQPHRRDVAQLRLLALRRAPELARQHVRQRGARARRPPACRAAARARSGVRHVSIDDDAALDTELARRGGGPERSGGGGRRVLLREPPAQVGDLLARDAAKRRLGGRRWSLRWVSRCCWSRPVRLRCGSLIVTVAGRGGRRLVLFAPRLLLHSLLQSEGCRKAPAGRSSSARTARSAPQRGSPPRSSASSVNSLCDAAEIGTPASSVIACLHCAASWVVTERRRASGGLPARSGGTWQPPAVTLLDAFVAGKLGVGEARVQRADGADRGRPRGGGQPG